ncbi:MAG: methylated-DNA--[protein]-cysteine S-methyltransferase [Alphaproteobacteria bacterium]|nr:methylated-DNA--[protein]-cysteine S-methyltransferase [Alphaproteobacteria bacterium]PHY01447.1 MAG: cysteine methyltransferase [Rhodospirillaceae bacterium]
MPQLSFHSPVGELTVSEEDDAIVSLDWGWAKDNQSTPLLRKAKKQLDSYFDGKLLDFDLPLNPAGTVFQKKVWRVMSKIPYGHTKTYGDVAKALTSAARAVGGACRANHIPIIIPCHRVLRSNGAMGGYSGDGGLDTKTALLKLEGAILRGI